MNRKILVLFLWKDEWSSRKHPERKFIWAWGAYSHRRFCSGVPCAWPCQWAHCPCRARLRCWRSTWTRRRCKFPQNSWIFRRARQFSAPETAKKRNRLRKISRKKWAWGKKEVFMWTDLAGRFGGIIKEMLLNVQHHWMTRRPHIPGLRVHHQVIRNGSDRFGVHRS